MILHVFNNPIQQSSFDHPKTLENVTIGKCRTNFVPVIEKRMLGPRACPKVYIYIYIDIIGIYIYIYIYIRPQTLTPGSSFEHPSEKIRFQKCTPKNIGRLLKKICHLFGVGG